MEDASMSIGSNGNSSDISTIIKFIGGGIHKEKKRRRGDAEKRRRDRINACLDQLEDLVPYVKVKKLSNKVEKAEVLELTVRFIKEVLYEKRYSYGYYDGSGNDKIDYLKHDLREKNISKNSESFPSIEVKKTISDSYTRATSFLTKRNDSYEKMLSEIYHRNTSAISSHCRCGCNENSSHTGLPPPAYSPSAHKLAPLVYSPSSHKIPPPVYSPTNRKSTIWKTL